ncbi:MAG TPA: NADP-dependent glyceraldehyde-3-phosphate dehydrogenase [Bacteroidia bacterium]|nr:NADP-dependent glyceraldehyde-3-phosphate dehydrogenase [Bacteroidia bacterium]
MKTKNETTTIAEHPQLKGIFPSEKDIPKEFSFDKPIEQTEYLIDGEIRTWNKSFEDVYSPVCMQNDTGKSTPRRLGKYPILDEKETEEALNAAVKAYNSGRGDWPTMTVKDRVTCMQQLITKMLPQKNSIVKMLMWEIGKSAADSEKEFDRTIEYMVDTVEELKKLDRESSKFSMQQGVLAQIRRSPLGVVLCMGPFNYPLNETFAILIPALIMGNTVILKPPRKGVLLYRFLLAAFKDAFPNGVINIIYGDGKVTSGALMKSGKIDVLAFIGSSKGATELKKLHPSPHRLRSLLGLESKNPAIILPDADMNLTVNECLLGTLSFNGQRCTALKMLFVHTKIKDAFLKKFADAVDQIAIGMPWKKGVQVTPMPDESKVAYMQALVDDAVAKGASIVNQYGGQHTGTFYFPTVLYPVTKGMKIYEEEQFGPVIPVLAYDSLDVPVDYIVNSPYGQQASIFGTNPEAMAQLIDPLINQVCRININSQCQRGPDSYPFCGRKNSAEGTLSVFDSLRAFSIRTLVAAKKNDLNEDILSNIVTKRMSNFVRTDYIF